jgi:nitrilase
VAEGANLVVLPERFHHYGPRGELHLEPEDGRAMQWLSDLAARHQIHLGGGVLLSSSGDRGLNTFALFGPDGDQLALYTKIHLFRLAELGIDESEGLDGGANPMVVETELGSIGLTICYDLRFPELFRGLRASGAEIMLVPSAFTVPTGQAHWTTLLRARAIENQVYVVAPDQVGDHAGVASPSYGGSQIVDPWGELLADVGCEGTGMAVAELSAERLDKIRRRLPCWEHRVIW